MLSLCRDDGDDVSSLATPSAEVPLGKGGLGRTSRLRQLDTGDAQVAAVLRKLQQVQGCDIPIMILGETGTGKDLLARAIHQDSERAGRAFVPINCAALPEALIESELFGYEEGAFTGARRRGSPGRIQMAHGGTLFLDEIGDMPVQLQARLLRVLQERRVTPLGSGKEHPVDVMLICATHCRLKSRMAQGLFRQDLYYRLNGLVLRLPPLRERTDFPVVVRRILHDLAGPRAAVAVSQEVMHLLQRHDWPGNIRELHNLLRIACAMAGPGGCIEVAHLPDDFLEELSCTPVQPLNAGASTGLAPGGADPHAAMAPEAWGPVALQPHAAPEGVPASGVGTGAARLQDLALQAMADALRQCQGNVSAAARMLGVSRNTLYRRKDQLPPDAWA